MLFPDSRRVLAEAARFDEFLSDRHGTLRLEYAWAALGKHTARLQRDWTNTHESIDLELVRHDSPTVGLPEGRNSPQVALALPILMVNWLETRHLVLPATTRAIRPHVDVGRGGCSHPGRTRW